MLIKVHACGVNPVETYIRSGNYARKPALPYTPGSDVAGVVEGVGEHVTAFKVFTHRGLTPCCFMYPLDVLAPVLLCMIMQSTEGENHLCGLVKVSSEVMLAVQSAGGTGGKSSVL